MADEKTQTTFGAVLEAPPAPAKPEIPTNTEPPSVNNDHPEGPVHLVDSASTTSFQGQQPPQHQIPHEGDEAGQQLTDGVPLQVIRPKLEVLPDGKHPFSAFYCHPTNRNSYFERPGRDSHQQARYSSEIDLEVAKNTTTTSDDPNAQQKPCTVWPGRFGKAQSRTKRSWNPLRGLSKRNKLLVKIAIALVIVAVAVAIGYGISRAVGGGVNKGIGDQQNLQGGTN